MSAEIFNKNLLKWFNHEMEIAHNAYQWACVCRDSGNYFSYIVNMESSNKHYALARQIRGDTDEQ